MKPQKGFTLVELLVVVTIIGILSAVAIPAYSDYVIRGKIPDATSALAITRTQMEQFYQDNHRYTTAAAGTTCGVTPSNGKFFTITCTATDTANSQSFTVTATGNTAGDTSMQGFTYTIDQSSNKTSVIVAPAKANWVAPQASCWITKSGGVC